MAVRGTKAKERVVAKLREAFGVDFLGEKDRKYYVAAQDEGYERVQIAIALTCPKNPVETTTVNLSNELDFENMTTVIAPTKFEPAEYTEEEKENVAKLLSMF